MPTAQATQELYVKPAGSMPLLGTHVVSVDKNNGAVAPADGTGSLPNLKPRGQGRWQVFLCAQGLKYLYVGQYENLPDAKHARDLAVLAVHGPKLVPTLEPVSNYSESDIAAVRAQMAGKPAARAVMVANGLWPPQGLQGDAQLHQPQPPRSRRLPGLQHTLQMIREEHKERMQQQQLASARAAAAAAAARLGQPAVAAAGSPRCFLQAPASRAVRANPTGTTGIREHKGVFEVFLATPPFKYLYVGRANSLHDARRMKATAMMAVYGSEVAVEQFGAEPHGVTSEDVRLMAVKLSAKPAALAAMRQYGTHALLTEAEAEAAAAAQQRAGPAAQQQLAQVQLQLEVQAALQAAAGAAAAAEQQQQPMGVGEQLRRPSRRQQRQHEQHQAVSEVLAAAAERLEDGEQALMSGVFPASNAAGMEVAAAAAKAQASVGGHRRSSRKRSAAAAFRLEQALLAAADEAEGAAVSGQESDATTGGLHTAQAAAAAAEGAPAAKRRGSRGASSAGASMQAPEQQFAVPGSGDLHAAAEAAACAAASAAGADERDVVMTDASPLAPHADPPAAAAAAPAAAGVLAEPSSSSRASADGEACVSISTRRSMIAKDGRLGSHTTGKLGVRTHKGGYEAFIATPPFKYLYVGLYRTVQAAVQARDTAMLVLYGQEAAAALGVGADSLASITAEAIQDMAARLAKKPQAVQAMQQYGTAHLLAGVQVVLYSTVEAGAHTQQALPRRVVRL
ncbi:hypothetical protein COO60DRAFT_1624321 [Scenedesmus sp. NREL 46B-D3]|nr:hypothetical protein COO60DRAFT_1624321 [Scenedesmus sp. NREL 46B-D3]